MKKSLILLLSLSSCGFATNIERVIEKAEPKVVKLGIVTDKGQGVCSGAFVTESGYILTCAHCFLGHGDIKKVYVKDSKEAVNMGVGVLLDLEDDLALIQTEDLGPFPYFHLGQEPKRGQEVISMGSPIGIQHNAAVGYVENLVEHKKRLIFHTAEIAPGSSGGPLLDLNGRLIGVNEGYMEDAEDLFIAIDTSVVEKFLKESIQ